VPTEAEISSVRQVFQTLKVLRNEVMWGRYVIGLDGETRFEGDAPTGTKDPPIVFAQFRLEVISLVQSASFALSWWSRQGLLKKLARTQNLSMLDVYLMPIINKFGRFLKKWDNAQL
jgi:hypothetical protein